MAWYAQHIEHRLHHKKERDQWLHARQLAQICRGAHSMWPLPSQPLDAADEEDFPKLKRLLRSLRILRVLDRNASAQSPGDPMAAAVSHYIERRILDQANYYTEKLKQARKDYSYWHRFYAISIWTAIIAGAGLFLAELLHSCHPPAAATGFLRFLIIIAPFAATHALGMMTIHDCRRRVRRYEDMADFLHRIAGTLQNCQANSSRLHLIEHAERMMIEEQHEWFSVTRNFSV